MFLSCKKACERASDYIEGPTSGVQRFALRLHLLMCKNCRRYYEQLRLAIGVVATLGPEAPTDIPDDETIDALVRKLSD